MAGRLRAVVPYFVALLVCAALYYFTTQITYAPRPGQIGPTFWPRVAIALMAAASIFEILRRLISGRSEGAVGVAENLDRMAEEAEPHPSAPAARWPLFAGIALTLAFALLVPVLGFVTASFVFVIGFMYIAGVRSHLTIWLVGAGGVLAFAFVFLKVVYISMPRGMPPFDQITQAVFDLLQIK
jgi:putative tricarboxylic transport membrane protein